MKQEQMSKSDWKQCIRGWEKIIQNLDYDSFTSIPDQVCELKFIFFPPDIRARCYFCDFADRKRAAISDTGGICPHCPGRSVSPKFDCMNKAYHFEENPREFLDKICKLYVLHFQESITVNGYTYYLK